MCWKELYEKKVQYGIYEYQVYVNGNRYEVIRYGQDESEVMLRGRLFDCDNDHERLQFIMEDILGLVEQMKEDFR